MHKPLPNQGISSALLVYKKSLDTTKTYTIYQSCDPAAKTCKDKITVSPDLLETQIVQAEWYIQIDEVTVRDICTSAGGLWIHPAE